MPADLLNATASRRYDVYAVGNAIVDIVTEVDNEFFETHGVEKGVMTLVDEQRQHELMRAIDMKKSRLSGGGSAGNTVVALSQFGGRAYYACVVAKDDLGKFYLDDLKRAGVDASLVYDQCPEGLSGRCLVMTSPDAQRTMNTFLGVSSSLSPAHLNEEAIRNSRYVYLEGYLVAGPLGLETLKEAKRMAERNGAAVALTFSDTSMVKYFAGPINEVVGAGVDLLFCNAEEAMIFTGAPDLAGAADHLKRTAKHFVVTLGADGALVFDGAALMEIEPHRVQAIDTNGAGDMFAGAFLYGITHGSSYAQAGRFAARAAGRVVAQWGPRLASTEAQLLLDGLVSG
jgi:sugar/nucleoside kinase (ribokinase family)